MPRPSSYSVAGYVQHLTHRCHNRDDHLRTAIDRDVYYKWLRVGVERYRVSLYGFAVTHTHTHVLAHVDDIEAVSQLMQLAAGSTAKQYNLRKEHLGSVWEHPYQCTLVETGEHLLNCLCYIDMNMVRAGAAKHPRDWRWCGYHELMGLRKRYRLLDLERLLATLGMGLSAFRRCYEAMICQRLAGGDLARQPCWTESLAVGSKEFVERVRQEYGFRSRFEVGEASEASAATWVLKESPSAYSVIPAAKSAPKIEKLASK